jgi:hypothetical protein
MNILLFGILLFALAFFVHILIWKIHLPKKNHTCFLLNIFFGLFIIGIFILPAQRLSDYIQAFLLYLSLMLAYIISYSAIEVDSPSLIIVLNIAGTGCGLSREELNKQLTDDLLVLPRLKDLLNDKMVFMEENKYKLTKKGVFLVKIFIFFRKILNAGKGG